MTLPEHLRAIADRIEAADEDRRLALEHLAALGMLAGDQRSSTDINFEPDDATALVAAEDQPGEGHASPPVPSPAPIPTRVESGPGASPATGGLPVRTTPPAAPAPALALCPGCGQEFPTQANVGRHRRFCKGKPAAASNGAPVIRKGRETFLCPRCERGFASNEALKGHLQKGHPPVSAPATRPFGERPVVDFPRGGGFSE